MTPVLVQFGRQAFVGWFAAPEAVARGQRVILRTARGVEPGVVLVERADFLSNTDPEGELLRLATPEDESRLATFPAREADLLASAGAEVTARNLPLTFVDAELTLDGRLILHALAWGACDATPLFDTLSGQFGLSVRMLDLSQTPVTRDPPLPASSCGKPGCGSEGGGGCSSCGTSAEGEKGEKGGCSTGSCSRGKVKSADELTAYFRDLRARMEQSTTARTPLV
ncbi:MAG: hypothetical protein K2V38_01345 [Gemmataceae bacterium]|nr:hypothetical protein [Gemmataceae bacterium]